MKRQLAKKNKADTGLTNKSVQPFYPFTNEYMYKSVVENCFSIALELKLRKISLADAFLYDAVKRKQIRTLCKTCKILNVRLPLFDMA